MLTYTFGVKCLLLSLRMKSTFIKPAPNFSLPFPVLSYLWGTREALISKTEKEKTVELQTLPKSVSLKFWNSALSKQGALFTF